MASFAPERFEVSGLPPIDLEVLPQPAFFEKCRAGASSGDATGQRVYAGARVLAELLAARPALVRSRRVMDLGCGAGLVGAVAAQLGAAHTALSDGEEETVALARRNVPAADSVQMLRWGAEHPVGALAGQFDVVCGGDLFYFAVSLPDLVHTASALLADGGCVLFAHVSRVDTHHDELVELAGALQLEVWRLPLERFMPPAMLEADPLLLNVTVLLVGGAVPGCVASWAAPYSSSSSDEEEEEEEPEGDAEALAAILARVGGSLES